MILQDLSEIYPSLPIEIILFFSMQGGSNGKLHAKKIFEFSEYYSNKYNLEGRIQPLIISNVCDILVNHGQMSLIEKSGLDNISSSYVSILRDSKVENDSKLKYNLNHFLSCLTYGFPYIYKQYKKFVLPLEFTDKLGDIALGTCFLFEGGIVTAKHCIEGAKKVAIQGISKEELSAAKFLIHKNPLMDIIYIKLKKPIENTILFNDDVSILDEIMTLGYPKIAAYHSFLAAENAIVSARFTATTGQIAAIAEQIFIRERLFLITAKIKGGNSGGPIINKKGSVVGVSVNLSTGEGNYDNLEYGTGIPIKYVIEEIINCNDNIVFDVSSIQFVDFK